MKKSKKPVEPKSVEVGKIYVEKVARYMVEVIEVSEVVYDLGSRSTSLFEVRFIDGEDETRVLFSEKFLREFEFLSDFYLTPEEFHLLEELREAKGGRS